ncbi:glycosyltransferase [Flavobacteriaceae bacterium]|nr:glycosyltransferase [Flavobacteriaceae bacterium]MDC3354643.1 glycosyltransferase [Flavobacteriaceae bacterium]
MALRVCIQFMDLCIIVPCFNEAKRIPLVDFETFLSHYPKVTLYFVNDGSTDETAAVIASFQKRQLEKVHLLNLHQNLGKGNAVRQGMLHALDNKGCDTFAYLDADLSTSLEECNHLAEQIKDLKQFVFGSRIKKIDNSIERKFFRFIIGRVIATAISKVLNLAVYDTQCGCKIFTKKTAKLAFGAPFISTWLFDVELFFRLKNHFGTSDFKTISAEVPLKKWRDQGGSKIEWTYGFKMWMDLLKIKRKYQ